MVGESGNKIITGGWGGQKIGRLFALSSIISFCHCGGTSRLPGRRDFQWDGHSPPHSSMCSHPCLNNEPFFIIYILGVNDCIVLFYWTLMRQFSHNAETITKHLLCSCLVWHTVTCISPADMHRRPSNIEAHRMLPSFVFSISLFPWKRHAVVRFVCCFHFPFACGEDDDDCYSYYCCWWWWCHYPSSLTCYPIQGFSVPGAYSWKQGIPWSGHSYIQQII